MIEQYGLVSFDSLLLKVLISISFICSFKNKLAGWGWVALNLSGFLVPVIIGGSGGRQLVVAVGVAADSLLLLFLASAVARSSLFPVLLDCVVFATGAMFPPKSCG